MALIKCRECGSSISTKAAACPSCGAPLKRNSPTISTGCGCLIIGMVALVLVAVMSRNGTQLPLSPQLDRPNPQTDRPHAASEKAIPYEVLKNEKRRGDGKLFFEVLVSEATSKQDVLRLAESLRREHTGKFAHICIYDSREAFQRQFDETYPEKELNRHNLVVIAGDLGEEVRWIGEGRDH